MKKIIQIIVSLIVGAFFIGCTSKIEKPTLKPYVTKNTNSTVSDEIDAEKQLEEEYQ